MYQIRPARQEITDYSWYQSIIDNLFDGVYYVDLEKRILFWNQRAEDITGYSREDVLGKKCQGNLLKHLDETGHELSGQRYPLTATLQDGQKRSGDFYLYHKQGYPVPISLRVLPIHDERGNLLGAVQLFLDRSQLHRDQETVSQLQAKSLIDQVTEIGNYRLTRLNLEHRFEELHEYQIKFGLLVLKIDHLTEIEEDYGLIIRDQVLCMVAKTLSTSIRRTVDLLTRWNQDEFIILFPNINERVLKMLAGRLSFLVKDTCLVLDQTSPLHVTLSVSGTMAQNNDSAHTLLERAHQTLAACQALGDNRISIVTGIYE
ncbi:GGDEF domain-containing protein [Spirulina subsalsa FACHB-351]|uniref:GGDEF domain-containing protein n=1 Tax=Spirulina subsalsa FACHB-351 TaxID=234711 RepID=A0ABT3L456_9CYAN|nr:GGDEF domain-containing protein [Spirulina subsalsa]MCW6036296.1 GGDEF domain-containing protein [Spirulina subsalsa FACHB-351]